MSGVLRGRQLIAAGGTLTLVGIALSVWNNAGIGSWLTVASLLGIVYGLHRFGRSGPDDPS